MAEPVVKLSIDDWRFLCAALQIAGLSWETEAQCHPTKSRVCQKAMKSADRAEHLGSVIGTALRIRSHRAKLKASRGAGTKEGDGG